MSNFENINYHDENCTGLNVDSCETTQIAILAVLLESIGSSLASLADTLEDIKDLLEKS